MVTHGCTQLPVSVVVVVKHIVEANVNITRFLQFLKMIVFQTASCKMNY